MNTARRGFAPAPAVAFLASGCGSGDTPRVASAGDLAHVHDLVLKGNWRVTVHGGSTWVDVHLPPAGS